MKVCLYAVFFIIKKIYILNIIQTLIHPSGFKYFKCLNIQKHKSKNLVKILKESSEFKSKTK